MHAFVIIKDSVWSLCFLLRVKVHALSLVIKERHLLTLFTIIRPKASSCWVRSKLTTDWLYSSVWRLGWGKFSASCDELEITSIQLFLHLTAWVQIHMSSSCSLLLSIRSCRPSCVAIEFQIVLSLFELIKSDSSRASVLDWVYVTVTDILYSI